MQLCRTNSLPTNAKRVVNAPVAGGTFWALNGANDLPYNDFVYGDLPFMLKNGSVWIGKAGLNPEWSKVESMDDLPKFKPGFGDDYDTVHLTVSPYMPQFYFVARNSRAVRFLRKRGISC